MQSLPRPPGQEARRQSLKTRKFIALFQNFCPHRVNRSVVDPSAWDPSPVLSLIVGGIKVCFSLLPLGHQNPAARQQAAPQTPPPCPREGSFQSSDTKFILGEHSWPKLKTKLIRQAQGEIDKNAGRTRIEPRIEPEKNAN